MILKPSYLMLLFACGPVGAPPDAGLSRDAGNRDAPVLLDAADAATTDVSTADAPDALAAVAPDAACAAPGCLRSATFVGDFIIDDIQPFLEAGVRIDNGYSVWTIAFETGNGESVATVTLPFRARAPIGGFHVVGNNHGTTGIGAGCGLTGTVYGTGLAGLYGARGMVGVALDYPGLGTTGAHPYLVAEIEGHAALDALRAATQLARWRAIPLSGRYAMTGLSQGGHATLAAAARHAEYAPDLDIRAFGAAAPASAWVEHWRAGAMFDGPHLVYHALLAHAWERHYGYSGPSPWATGFDPAALESACIFNIRDNELLESVVPTARTELFNADFLMAYTSGEWGPYAAYETFFESNRIAPFDQTAPIRIYQGTIDETVPEYATTEMVEALREGGVEIDYQVVEDGTHLNVAFGFVAAAELRTEESISWLRAQLD